MTLPCGKGIHTGPAHVQQVPDGHTMVPDGHTICMNIHTVIHILVSNFRFYTLLLPY